MVNHVKTLLLNMTASDLQDAGVEFYVDPGFVKLHIPEYLQKSMRIIVPDTTSAADRLRAVESLFTVISRVDLSDRLGMYDDRITPNYFTEESVFVPGTTATDINISVFVRSHDDDLIFRATGDESIDNELRALKKLYLTENDGHKKFAAKVLALVAQLENIRRHS